MSYFLLFLSVFGPFAFQSQASELQEICGALFSKRFPRDIQTKLEVEAPFSNLLFSSLEDPTRSTGATLFYFPEGARASFDSRGGSVASAETDLLLEGSYSNEIDGIVFAGGSTMGLEAASGVRAELYARGKEKASAFDRIPSIPSAVVYDPAGRALAQHDQLVYPSLELGRRLYQTVGPQFKIGRFGAGTNTTANKMGIPYWSGQGASVIKMPWGHVFVAVILNPVGDVFIDGKSFAKTLDGDIETSRPPVPGKNTTLSIVITDVPLNRSQLKRLAQTVHTSMAASIRPFQTYGDGDILFAVSTSKETAMDSSKMEDLEWELTETATAQMKIAISQSVLTANGLLGKEDPKNTR